jgi:predicted ester cyclase
MFIMEGVMSDKAIMAQLRREITPELYEQIRREWKAHSIAEDGRDLAGLLATLTDDCVYELVQTGHVWHGHAGATRFYTELLTAFPDIHFDLQHIVIGPQGVWEEAHVTATYQQAWLDYPATGQPVEFEALILFPWDPEKQKFKGERVHVIGLEAILSNRRPEAKKRG